MATAFVPKRTPPKPPTIEEMQARLPGLMLYSPAEEWIPMEVHGLTIFATPDLNGAIEAHPVTGQPTECNGITDIKGRLLQQKDSSGKRIEGQDAYSRMTYLIHKERFGEMGMCWLPGQDPTEDEQYKVFAKEQYLKYQAALDDKVLERRREFVANWKKNPSKQGVKVPPPSVREQGAIERSELRERVRTYEFECPLAQQGECDLGYATNDWAKFVGHMKAAHGIEATRTDGGYTMSDSEGKRLKVTAAAALGEKVTLTDADLEREDQLAGQLAEKNRAIDAHAERLARAAPRRKAR